MEPMFLREVEKAKGSGRHAEAIQGMQAASIPIPQILHLFAYKADRTEFLTRFTQGVMRGPSPLPAWQRELIAAFTSKRNRCRF